MKKITLFVGDCNESLCQTAKQFDSEAVLIDQSNFTNFTNSTSGFTGYTSLADLPKDLSVFYDLLNCADEIVYCPPNSWSDQKTVNLEDPTNSIQGLTEYYLYVTSKNKNNVVGLDLSNFDSTPYINLKTDRPSNDRSLWVVGCSTTAGIGVDDNERYGVLLSKRLNLPVSFLADPGSSINWAADQILRSDIQEQDIVVWGLTSEDRMSFWNPSTNKLMHVHSHSKDVEQLKLSYKTINQLLVHETNLLSAIQKIYEVSNFCNKIKAKLLIFNIHSSNTLNLHLNNVKEFLVYLSTSNKYIDVGNDNRHPGPKQHQAYADFCHSALKQLKYI